MCQHHAVLRVGSGPLGVCRQCGKLVPIKDGGDTGEPKDAPPHVRAIPFSAERDRQALWLDTHQRAA